jgi:formylglycine-generating enzyme required for sulfatase activity
VIMKVSKLIFRTGFLLVGFFLLGDLHSQSVYVNMGKGWSYITGAQRAVNDSNRVYYIMGNPAGGEGQSVQPLLNDGFTPHLGHRVNNFNEMKDYYPHDSEFTKAHLTASQVYEAEKMVDGPTFFISKTEVTNAEYRKFVEFCIQGWMKENRPEIVQKYKWESPEYVQAVQAWLESGSVSSAAGGAQSSSSLLPPAKTWWELYLRNLDWKKIEYKGKSIFPNTEVWTYRIYRYNCVEGMHIYYFVHPVYNDYPVVGVSKDQADYYCLWYTDQNGKQEKYHIEYRLPTELEWERAASVIAVKRSKKSSGSPVYNNYMRNAKGVYIANFRPQVDNFAADGGIYPTPVESYYTNDAGCYNMQGNVAEWTSNEVQCKVGEYTEEMNIIKGGAWNLPEAACTIGSRGIIYYGVAGEEPATSYVGFRMVAVPMKKFRPLITPEF